MTEQDKVNLDDLAMGIVALFPELDAVEQRLSLELYRLLATGQPVPRPTLAERLDVPCEIVNEILKDWPGVFSDSQQRVIGYWGLSIPAAHESPHRLTINGRTLSAWCAWDTLFLPQLLGQTAETESASPNPGVPVGLTVTPERVTRVDPAGAQMSFLLPDTTEIHKDIVTTFCHFIHFFPSRQAAENWTAQHAGTFVLSIEEAHLLAHRKNEAQYKDVLR